MNDTTPIPIPDFGPKTVERFWAKVDKNRPGQCWIWTGNLTSQGYGCFTYKDRAYRAHRIALKLHGAEPPCSRDIYPDHLCRNRRCVNPAHLELVSNSENVLRGSGVTALNLAKKTCKRGHPLDHIQIRKNGSKRRQCRTCFNMHKKEYRKRDSHG